MNFFRDRFSSDRPEVDPPRVDRPRVDQSRVDHPAVDQPRGDQPQGQEASIDLALLRGRLESLLPEGSVLSVTSAKRGDGKSFLTFSLAEDLARVGYRVLVIDANHYHPELWGAPSIDAIDPLRDGVGLGRYAGRMSTKNFDGLSLAHERFVTSLSRDGVRSLLAHVKHVYHYVLIDTTPLSESVLSLLLCSASHGTLVTVRRGRSIDGKDERTARLIAESEIAMLGIVEVGSRTISDFRDDAAQRGLSRNKSEMQRMLRLNQSGTEAAPVA